MVQSRWLTFLIAGIDDWLVAHWLIVDRVVRQFGQQLRIHEFWKRIRQSLMPLLETPNRAHGERRLDANTSPHDRAG